MYKHILLATDGSELSDRALKFGIKVAQCSDAKVTVITAIRPWHTVAPGEMMLAFPEAEYLKGATANAQSILDRAEKIAQEANVECEALLILRKEPWQAITEAAEDHGCDLIVMGSHGRSGLSKLILGSETQKVLTHATVPVLVHR